jgi:hypothetical protein
LQVGQQSKVIDICQAEVRDAQSNEPAGQYLVLGDGKSALNQYHAGISNENGKLLCSELPMFKFQRLMGTTARPFPYQSVNISEMDLSHL